MTEKTAKEICDLNARTYSRIARQFSNTRARPWDDVTPLVEFLKDGMSILDVGCGNGRLLTAIPKDLQIFYVGIDVSPKFPHEARGKYAQDSRTPQFLSGNILSLRDISDIQGEQFDAISAVAVLNHIPSHTLRLRALSEMQAFLKPGGMLFLTNWNLLQVGVRKNVWKYAWERFRISDSEWQDRYGFSKKGFGIRDCMTVWKSGNLAEPLYYYSFTLSELARLCRTAGFRVHDVYYSRKGKRAHWWNGKNSVVIARKA